MKVEVTTTEVIKPSASKPHHSAKFTLSYLDQLATSNYVPILLFYLSNDSDNNESPQVKSHAHLKQSLSETLASFYHVAGRIREGAYIDCNDEGVEFIQARVDCRLPEFLDSVKIDQLDQFLPCETSVSEAELSGKPLLAVQLNVFYCGGVAIGACFSHKIGDGVSMAAFFNNWAAMNRGVDQTIPSMYFNLSSLFPMKEDSPNVVMPTAPAQQPKPNITIQLISMKVEVTSTEVIKPSASKPHHSAKFTFSYLDQLATSNYVPIFLFYLSNDSDNNESPQVKSHAHLKQSLSETLARFYHVAGRIREGAYIDCNDEGVEFIQARVDCRLPEFLDSVKIDQLDQFLPCETSVNEADLSSKPLLAVQLNAFDCGGVAIGVCISHKIGDGLSMAAFLNNWAAMNRGLDQTIPSMYFNLSSLFPMKEDSLNVVVPTAPAQLPKPNIVTKIFVFDASSIARLRALGSSMVENPTRVELVSALIWRRAMTVAGCEKDSAKVYAAMQAVNLRQRMVPPLPSDVFGNVVRSTITEIITEEMESAYHDLVAHIRSSIRKVDGNYVKELQTGKDGFMNRIREAREKNSGAELVAFNFNSWCRFPFYQVNFGWGTPSWIGTTKLPGRNLIVLMDTRSGDGIEAWVNMLEADMALLEHDQEFLSYALSK